MSTSTENKTVTIDARHTFTDAEMSLLGVNASRSHREHQRAEEEMKSAAKDWKAKLDRIALERDGVLRKLGDGFEMRPIQAVVRFNDPAPGRKSYFRFDPQFTVTDYEEIVFADAVYRANWLIREEAMDATDYQRDLPLDGITQAVVEALHEPEPVAPAVHTCHHGIPDDEECARCRDEAEVIAMGHQPIGTSIADKLAQAAQGKTLAPVVIDFPANYGADKYRGLLRKAAKKQGWPEVCVDLIDEVAQTTQHDSELGKNGCAKRVLDVLQAHSISAAESEERMQADHDGEAERTDTRDENERLAGTFGETEGAPQ